MPSVRYPVDPITLRIDGVDWAFWKNTQVVRQMDAVAGTFAIGLADKWVEGASALPIAAGMECQVLIGKTKILTGYIDKASPSFSASDHGIVISGRDKSGDLVDCSAVHKPGHWQGLNAEQLCAELAAPFGVDVVTAVGVDIGAPFPSFKLEQGETAFEAMDRILKQRELLIAPDGGGGLVIVTSGILTSQTALVQGENILSASAAFDMTDRFSDYLVQGQQPGNDEVYGKQAAAVHAANQDPAVTRYRPLILRAESRVDSGAAQQRAAWECTVRAARSVTVSVTVQGFRQCPDGPLWMENSLTDVDIPFLRISQQLLISKVSYARDAQGGSLTAMELKDPKSFTQEPKSAGAASGGGAAPKDYTIEAEKDLQTRSAENAAKAHRTIKEGA